MRIVAITTLGVALWAAPAGAQSLAELKALLASADDFKAEEAAQKLGASTDPKALDALLDGLALGATPDVQSAMLRALSGRKDSRTLDVLRHFARNRNPELRKRALTALAALPDARVVTNLLEALSDPAEEVRAVAAKALGDRKERSAEPRLIQLLRRKDAAAAAALAALGTPELAHKLAELIGEVPDALVCSALGDMLKRPDFGPDPIRVEIVRALSKVPGVDSTSALIEYVAATEKDKTRPSRGEAQKIIDQRSSQQ